MTPDGAGTPCGAVIVVVTSSTSPAARSYDTSAGAPALRLFLDGSVIEAFTSAGRVATARVYPTQPPPWRLTAPAGAVTWALGEA